MEEVYNTLLWLGKAAGVLEEAEELVATMQRQVEPSPPHWRGARRRINRWFTMKSGMNL